MVIIIKMYDEDGTHEPEADAPLSVWLAENAEDEETCETLQGMKPGDEVWMGGGAQPRTLLVAEEG